MAWCLWHQRLFHKWQHESQAPATHAAIYEINVDLMPQAIVWHSLTNDYHSVNKKSRGTLPITEVH